jgi:4-aminobutyrate aminotransferase
MSHLSNVWFKVTDLQVTHGKGCRVTTTDGAEYLDFAAGIAVNSTGHAHPRVAAAIAAQADKFIHAQINVFTHDLAEPLASEAERHHARGHRHVLLRELRCRDHRGRREAREAGHQAPERHRVPGVVPRPDPHGDGDDHLEDRLPGRPCPLPGGVFVSPFPDPLASDQEATINAALKAFDRLLLAETAPSETAAVIMEPVLGEGGYIPAPKPFLEGIAARCREHGILFIADEVQSGFGRTGNWFAIEGYDVEPDIICMAKGIASGFPFAALGTRRELDDLWPKGSHGGTYGGNVLGCAAALATIEIMSEPGFLDNVRSRGQQLRDALAELQQFHPVLRQVRGPGLMVGTSFDDPARVPKVVQHCLHEGRLILMNAGTYGNVIRWMPPLVVTADEIDEAVQAFANALKATA